MARRRHHGEVLSVDVGQPRTIDRRGQEVRTAIWKAPVAGRRRVRRLNVDGDGQADLVGHGGEHRAVFVYQAASYRYWEGELERTLADAGQFGENLTVAGVPDDEVCIGDRFSIGSALFEVTQPRVTCFKVRAGPCATPSPRPRPSARSSSSRRTQLLVPTSAVPRGSCTTSPAS
jgi:MOSC domain-containing protein YiiM